jgi:hypothetical protein
MLFALDPPGKCVTPSGFLLAPLPTRKQLWEAPDADAWMLERCRDIGGIPSVFGVLQNGQMVKLHEFHGLRNGQAFVVEPRQVEESAKNWQEWWDTDYACCDSANIVSSGIQRLRKGGYCPRTVFVGNAIACWIILTLRKLINMYSKSIQVEYIHRKHTHHTELIQYPLASSTSIRLLYFLIQPVLAVNALGHVTSLNVTEGLSAFLNQSNLHWHPALSLAGKLSHCEREEMPPYCAPQPFLGAPH